MIYLGMLQIWTVLQHFGPNHLGGGRGVRGLGGGRGAAVVRAGAGGVA